MGRTIRRNLRAFALARMRTIPANKDAGSWQTASHGSRLTERSNPSPRPQAANASPSADSPLVSANRSAVPSPPAGPFLCSAQRKGRKKCARGNLYRGGFPGTPSPTPKGPRPLGTPVGFTRDEGRGTRDKRWIPGKAKLRARRCASGPQQICDLAMLSSPRSRWSPPPGAPR